MMTAEETADLCLQLAEVMYAKHGRAYVHPAVLHIVIGEKHDIVFLPDFGGPASKVALRALCIVSAGSDADLLAFVCEGWMLAATSTEEAMVERHKVMDDLSLHPERVEVLMVEVQGPASGWSITGKLDRSGERTKILKWRSEKPGQNWHNRFLSDLPWKETTRT